MTPEEAIQVADKALFTYCGNSLTDIQRLILRESLADKGYEEMEGYVHQHIKNTGKEFWRLLSQALGEKVSKTNFKGALEKRWRAGGIVINPPELTAYNLRTWVGRKEIIEDLLCKLQEQTRLLWIAGISGIGKTTLGECLASKAWDYDQSFQWIHLEILEGQSFDFASFATDLLAKLGEKDLDPQERNDPKRLINRLLQKLKVNRYWIQLDSLERLLDSEQPDEFVDSHWLNFLQRYLAEPNLVSRLVLTAQALPAAVAEFGDRYPNVWQEITLRGLFADDRHNEHLELFEKNGITMDESNRSMLSRIGSIYEGHPLVLQVLAKEIRAIPFQGNVAEYWQRYGNEFEQVARELQTDRVNPALYNQALQKQVRRRVEASLKRLPTDALDLLCRSSVYRRPVPEMFWLALIEDKSPTQQQEAYQILCDRALVEKESVSQRQFLIRQHNLIRDIAYTQLKNNSTFWKFAEQNAANLWLTAYKPNPNSPNLEKVRGYLEAIDHYCEIEDWDRGKELFTRIIDTSAKYTLSWQLDVWSYFWEEIRLCQKLLGKCDLEVDVKCWKGIGNAYLDLCDYPKTISAYNESIRIAREIGDRKSEGSALGSLGLAHTYCAKYHQANEFYQQHLMIVQEIGDRTGECNVFGNLGLNHTYLGNYDQAIEFNQQSLLIKQELGDLRGEAISYGNLGLTYSYCGEYKLAVNCYLKQLTIFQEIDDRAGEGNAFDNLGKAYNQLGEYQLAIFYHQKTLEISREIGDRRVEGYALANWGDTLINLEQYVDVVDKAEEALAIFQSIGAKAEEIWVFKSLALLNHKLGQITLARQYWKQTLALAMELEIPLATEYETFIIELESKS
jgi:tetratricopeptide (TPR) repeat protein